MDIDDSIQVADELRVVYFSGRATDAQSRVMNLHNPTTTDPMPLSLEEERCVAAILHMLMHI